MATQVEITSPLTSRTVQSGLSDLSNDVKSPRTHVNPLSDASNKSTDSGFTGSLFIEETSTTPTKFVSRFNPANRPRISPKPFSRENPPETRKSIGLIPRLPLDVKSPTDVPSKTSTNMSWSESGKNDEDVTISHRRFRSSIPPSSEDHTTKSEEESYGVTKLYTSTWVPGAKTTEESLSTNTVKHEVSLKPPVTSKKPATSQGKEQIHLATWKKASPGEADEQKEGCTDEQSKGPLDSASVRAQVRPRRRPVSAMFLNSINDQSQDTPVTSDEKTSTRRPRPLSVDLTAKFENISCMPRKGSTSEETKENIPLKKNVVDNCGEIGSNETSVSLNSKDTVIRRVSSGISSRNTYLGFSVTDLPLKGNQSNREQDVTDNSENQGVLKLAESYNNQETKPLVHKEGSLPDGHGNVTCELKNTDESGIEHGMIRRRISLLLANTSSSGETTDPAVKNDTESPIMLRQTKVFTSDKVDMNSERPWSSSQSQSTTSDLAKNLLSSPPNTELRSEKPLEAHCVSVPQDAKSLKDKRSEKSYEMLEEKQMKPMRSFRYSDEPLKVEDKERTSFHSKYKPYDTSVAVSERLDKIAISDETPFKTVRATMFDHNVERHSTSKVYHASDPEPNQAAKYETSPGVFPAKTEYYSCADRFDGAESRNRHRVENKEGTGIRIINSWDRKALSSTERTLKTDIPENVDYFVPTPLKIEEDTIPHWRIEPRYEIMQTVGERVLSESIKMVPEDKAVTLRSRRSFNSKERESEKPGFDISISDRPGGKLQRSKSEYRRRATADSSQDLSKSKPISRDFVQIDAKHSFRSENSSVSKALTEIRTEGTNWRNQAITVSDSVVDIKGKSNVRTENKALEKNTLDLWGQEKGSDKITRADPKIGELSGMSPISKMNKQIQEPVEKGSESRRASAVPQDKLMANVEESVNRSNQISDFKRLPYQCPKSFAEDDTRVMQKISAKAETTDKIKSMLNEDIEQMKKELTPMKTLKEVSQCTSGSGWTRGGSSFYGGTGGIKGDHLITEKPKRDSYMDQEEKTNKTGLAFPCENTDTVCSPIVKDMSPFEAKATYFAVTYIDKKKERDEKEFGNRDTVTSVTDDYTMQTNVSLSKPHNILQNEPVKGNLVLREDFEKSNAETQPKAYRSQRVREDEDFRRSNEKTLQNVKRNIIDIDAVLRRHKEKTVTEDNGSTYKDTYGKLSVTRREVDHKNMRDVNSIHQDDVYKSKAVDIDALMVDYKSKSKEDNVIHDLEEKGQWKFERSRSFRSSGEKSPSGRWKDPSVKSLAHGEGSQYDFISSWSTSGQTTAGSEPKKDQKLVQEKSECVPAEHFGKKSSKLEEQHIYTHVEKSQNVTVVDSLLASARQSRFDNKSHSNLSQDYPEAITGKSSRYSSTRTVVPEKSVDDYHDTPSIMERKSKSNLYTEKRRPAKTSDIINMMLENKERAKREHRARQSFLEEHTEPSRTQTTSRQRESIYRDYKEYSEREVSSQQPVTLQDVELRRDSSERRSRRLYQEKAVHPQQDQVKQCFTRTSSTHKDTDSLVPEPDRHYGTWSHDQQQNDDGFTQDSPSFDNVTSRKQPAHSRLSSLSQTETDQHDSITDLRDASLDRSSLDLDSTDGTESTPSFKEARVMDFSFMDQTSVLDSTALKNRVQLSRKSQRRAPSQSQRRSRLLQSSSQLAVIEDADSPWMYTDSTDAKAEKKEDSDEDEKPQRIFTQSQRMPVFPGINPSTLMAQLRKRPESSGESPAQPSKSPKSPLPQGTLGIKLLPTSTDKQDKGAEESPQWLKELKSKKRLSQYENQS